MKDDDAQNSARAAKGRRRGRPWKPGQSGNPGGRPRSKGLPQLIRRRTKHGRLLIKPLIQIAKGERVRIGNRWVRPTLDDMMAAIRELMDRGYGKTVTALELEEVQAKVPIIDARTVSLSVPLSDEERAVARKILQATRPAGALTTKTSDDDEEGD